MSREGSEGEKDPIRQICVVCGLPAEICQCEEMARELEGLRVHGTGDEGAPGPAKTSRSILVSAVPGQEAGLRDRLKGVPEIVEVHPLFGGHDCIAEVAAEDFESHGQIVIEKIRIVPGVRSAGEISRDKASRVELQDIYLRELAGRLVEKRKEVEPAERRLLGASLRDLLTHLDIFRFTRRRGRRPPRGSSPLSAPA
jgi:DNA-binding Lrp family transcriptional regulator